jgi:SAM-dependent methyltransferase
MSLDEVAGKNVADIGSGTGRIVNMLLDAGAAHVTALEPSAGAFEVLVQNTRDRSDRVHLIEASGELIPADMPFDLVFCLGVLHHVREPDAIVRQALQALKPGGKMLVWLYGREGNRIYLALVRPLRSITKRLPHPVLAGLCYVLDAIAVVYASIARILSVPMRQYVRGVYLQLPAAKRRLVIFDQLNPSYAKYYSREEARRLLAANGFVDVKLHHRHGYSWTVCGDRA